MNASDISAAILAVNSMEDLRKINDALRIRWKELQNRQTRLFSKGDKVEFTTRSGVLVRATVTKLNQKSVSVLAENGTPWKVGANLLRFQK